jgi:hypothetical protein
VLTEHSGQVQIEVPRYRAGTMEPQIVHKRLRRQRQHHLIDAGKDRAVVASALARTDRHTAMQGGRGGLACVSPKSTASHRSSSAAACWRVKDLLGQHPG